MSGGIAVKTLDTAGGQQLAGHQDWFSVEGQLAVCKGDPVEGGGSMAEGSDWMSLDGAPVCRAGDHTTSGTATTGRSWFTIA